MFNRVLFATDFSDHAETAKKVAATLAREDGNKLWVLTVLEPLDEPLTMVDEPPMVSPEVWEMEVEEEEVELEHEDAVRLHQDVAELEAAGLDVTEIIRVGDPAKEILDAAEEIGADVIVLGSHSRRTIRDVLLGDTAAHVAKHASCPVLTICSCGEGRKRSPKQAPRD
ncbi:MAG: universal stress protein [Gammaproteobacteria bacterium]|nr:universal stress protein [Gammaproteobacteria bacterium]